MGYWAERRSMLAARDTARAALPPAEYSPTARAAHAYALSRRASDGGLGAKAMVRKYAHGDDCRRLMTVGEFERSYAGGRARMVRRLSREDREDPRWLVHLCGVGSYDRCGHAHAYNRIPDSRVSSSDTTAKVGRKGAENAMRDSRTEYGIGRRRHYNRRAH